MAIKKYKNERQKEKAKKMLKKNRSASKTL